MPSKVLAFAAAGSLFALVASSAVAAPLVTMVQSTQTRTQIQGAGTYGVLDFFWTNTPGAEFTNYRIIVNATIGSLFDPSRLQDDRQMHPQSGLADGNTAGAVDTWANTVMSAAAKDDGGYFASRSVNPGSYNPTGLGAAPPFTFLDWSVFDTAGEDDNDLTNHSDGVYTSTAPYHIARILTSVGALGTVQIQAFDTSSNGNPTIYNFTGFGPAVTRPIVNDAVITDVNRNDPGVVMHTFTQSGGTPPVTWDQFQFVSYTPMPNHAGDGTPAAANATFDPADQTFSWHTVGAPRGSYIWSVRASNSSGSDTGTLTIRTEVPEPTSVILVGLAMLTGIGFRRRQ
jgi:hypothetical protein